MPLLLALPLAIVLMLLVSVALWPLALYLRVRASGLRRPVRGWTLTLQLASTTVSAVLLLLMAAVAGQWWVGALSHAAAGLLAGALLGLAGRWPARIESLPGGLFVTPSRALAWGLIGLVVVRVLAGLWQSAQVVFAGATWPQSGWLSHAGLMGLAAVLVGYGLGSALWQRHEWRRHQRVHRVR